jgi:aldose 1-epimerase
MSRYEVGRAEREGEALVVLRNVGTGAEARIWPGCGNNCFSLTLPDPAGSGRLVTVIQDPPALDEIRRRPSWWGIPLLFPFPGVIPQGEYVFEGQRLRLGRSDQPIISEGNERPGARRDYHGFVMDLPWTVAEERADATSATVRSTLNSADHPEAHEGFPFAYRLQATYTLDERGLHLEFRAENPAGASGKLPFGFGAHPFFKLPLGERGSPAECLVSIPAGKRFNARAARELIEQHGQGNVPEEAWEAVQPTVPLEIDLRVPRPFVEKVYNGMFTGLETGGAPAEAFIRDPHNGLETVMRAGPEFPNIVFWSPPGRSELCFEPWTSPSNVFNLAAQGVPGNGMTVLEPGEHWTGRMSIGLRTAKA